MTIQKFIPIILLGLLAASCNRTTPSATPPGTLQVPINSADSEQNKVITEHLAKGSVYRSDDFRISFTVPSDLEVSTRPHFHEAILLDPNATDAWPQIEITHADTPEFNPPAGTELNKWFDEHFKIINDTKITETTTTIDGEKAIKQHSPRTVQSPSFTNIYWLRDGKLYQMSFINDDTKSSQAYYNQVLQSFKFNK